jgi:hypothetical protein
MASGELVFSIDKIIAYSMVFDKIIAYSMVFDKIRAYSMDLVCDIIFELKPVLDGL